MSLTFSLQTAVSGIPAALLEGLLVFLPRASALAPLTRLRSPWWTVVLPGSIAVGTFGMLLAPGTASTFLVVAAVTTPVLAAIAVACVVRSRWLILPAAALAGGVALAATGATEQLGASIVTALACLTIGATLQCLIPGRWLALGVITMSAVDVALLAAGFGYHQTQLLAAAANNFPGPHFTGARVGATTIGYPDLFLAALLGASLAGRAEQRRAAGLLVGLVVAYDSLLAPGVLLPATVPIAATLVIVMLGAAARRRGRFQLRFWGARSSTPAARFSEQPVRY